MPDIKELVPDQVVIQPRVDTVFNWFKNAQHAGVDAYGLAIFAGFLHLLEDDAVGMATVTLSQLDKLLDYEFSIDSPQPNTVRFMLGSPETEEEVVQ